MKDGIAVLPLGRRFLLLALVECLLVITAMSSPPAGKPDSSVAGEADLTVSNGFSDSPFEGSYLFNISNHGPDVARNVVFRFVVPGRSIYRGISNDRPLTCSIPPATGGGELVCSIGDMGSNAQLNLSVSLELVAPAKTKLAVTASASSETPDPNPNDNLFTFEPIVLGDPQITSVRVLKRPFRIEIEGENLRGIPPISFGLGIGCDCQGVPRERIFRSLDTMILLQGDELKSQFRPGVPTWLCYFDQRTFPTRVIRFAVTR